MSWHEGLLYGLLGGALAELLGWYKLRQEEKLPPWTKSKFYWIMTLLMVGAGGGLVIVYLQSGIDLKPILAVNVGASAPLILGSLVAPALPTPSGKTD